MDPVDPSPESRRTNHVVPVRCGYLDLKEMRRVFGISPTLSHAEELYRVRPIAPERALAPSNLLSPGEELGAGLNELGGVGDVGEVAGPVVHMTLYGPEPFRELLFDRGKERRTRTSRRQEDGASHPLEPPGVDPYPAGALGPREPAAGVRDVRLAGLRSQAVPSPITD